MRPVSPDLTMAEQEAAVAEHPDVISTGTGSGDGMLAERR
jgi:hypothetical protein